MWPLSFLGLLLITVDQCLSHTILERDAEIVDDYDIVKDDPGQECWVEVNFGPEDVVPVFKEFLELEGKNDRMNKYLECTWTKYGYLTDDGKISVLELESFAKILLYVNELNKLGTILKLTIKDCASDPSGVHNDTAVKAHNCMVDKMSSRHRDVVFATYAANEKCLTELHLDRRTATSLFNSDIKVAEGKDKTNKYLNCLWSDIGWLTENGTVDASQLSSFLTSLAFGSVSPDDFGELPIKILKACDGVEGSNSHETVEKFNACIIGQVLHPADAQE